MLAVFIHGGGADRLQFATGEGGFHHIAGIHGTGGGTGTDDLMEFVDKEDDFAFGALDFFDGAFEAFFKFTAEATAGEHAAEIKAEDALAEEQVRHIARSDFLRQAFDDGGLADAGFADQHRVVFGAAAEHLDDAQDFGIASDDGVELAFQRHACQVAAVFFQGSVAAFGLRVGDALPAADVFDGVGDAIARDAIFRHHFRHGGVSFVEQGEEDVLGADVFVAEPVGFFVGAVDDALQAGGDEDLVGALPVNGGGAGAGTQDIVRAGAECADIDSEPLEDLGDDAIGLLEQGEQDVLGVHLGVAIAMEDFVGAGGGVLGAFGKAVKSDHRWSFTARRDDVMRKMGPHLLYSRA